MKPNFEDGHPFSKHLLWRWEKERFDEQASVP